MRPSIKRPISSCIPCYRRKQKCNRECPCNHCSRRQCPEACVFYHNTPASSSISSAPADIQEPPASREEGTTLRSHQNSFSRADRQAPTRTWQTSGEGRLVESYGYCKHSKQNTFALIQQLGLAPTDTVQDIEPALTSDAIEEGHRIVEHLPDRPIMDYLVDFFVAEIAWLDQLVDIPWFLAQYRSLHNIEEAVSRIADVDFVLLVLRICSYAARFLPSPAYPLDRIRGVLLADLQHTFEQVANRLQAVRCEAESPGSLALVQQYAFSALKCQVEGKMDKFVELLHRAVRVALRIDLHVDAGHQGRSDHDERSRRVFCNLYIWDSQVQRQLDHAPAILDHVLPQQWASPDPFHDESRRGSKGSLDAAVRSSNEGTFDQFAERTSQVHLAAFWRNVSSNQGGEYDVVAAEEAYDRFSREFLPQLPATLAINTPDQTWDQIEGRFPLQRQLLHMAIFDSVCWHFRPVLLWRPDNLPAYKAVLVASQQRTLASAALRSLNSVSQFHSLLGNRHTRIPAIVTSTFEAAVVLFSLLMDPAFPKSLGCEEARIDSTNAMQCHITRQACTEGAQTAVARLRMLGEVSSLADISAATLQQLQSKVSETTGRSSKLTGNDRGQMSDQIAVPVSSSSHARTTSLATTAVPIDMTDWLPPWDGMQHGSGNSTADADAGTTGEWLSYDTAGNMMLHQDFVDDSMHYYGDGSDGR